MLKPGTPAPMLDVALVGGGHWRLRDQAPETFTLIVFYRGYHCPVCRSYLQQLEKLLGDYAAEGVTSVVAVSGDSETRAARSVEEWDLERLTVGYGQSVTSMREWGLFISKGINDDEPPEFGEPGLILIRPDGTVYAEAVNSMPFGRPHLDEIIKGVHFVNASDYPARGES